MPRSTTSRRASRARWTGWCELLAAACRQPRRDAGRAQSLGRCADRRRVGLRRANCGPGPTRASRCSSTAISIATRFGTPGGGIDFARAHDRRRRRIPRPFRTRSRRRRISDGRALIEDVIGRPIAGFIAPAWLYGPGAHEALADCAMPIAEDHMRVWSPATGAELARGPVITWASRTRLRLASSLAAAAALRRLPTPGAACRRPSARLPPSRPGRGASRAPCGASRSSRARGPLFGADAALEFQDGSSPAGLRECGVGSPDPPFRRSLCASHRYSTRPKPDGGVAARQSCRTSMPRPGARGRGLRQFLRSAANRAHGWSPARARASRSFARWRRSTP